MIVAKNNYERSNENLLQNNQILKRLEVIKNLENEKSASKMRGTENVDGDGYKTRDLRYELSALQEKNRKLEASVI